MCNPLEVEDRTNQQSIGPEYGENLFSIDSDYIDVGELSTSKSPQGNLNIIQLNVRGLISKQSKLSELINKVEKSLDLHALILCETWLTPETKNLIKQSNFTYSGIERKEKKGGGVGFLIKNNLIFRERIDLKINAAHWEHHIIEIKCRGKNLLLASIYRPPNTQIAEFLNEYESLLQKLNKKKEYDVIIGLDHN